MLGGDGYGEVHLLRPGDQRSVVLLCLCGLGGQGGLGRLGRIVSRVGSLRRVVATYRLRGSAWGTVWVGVLVHRSGLKNIVSYVRSSRSVMTHLLVWIARCHVVVFVCVHLDGVGYGYGLRKVWCGWIGVVKRRVVVVGRKAWSR